MLRNPCQGAENDQDTDEKLNMDGHDFPNRIRIEGLTTEDTESTEGEAPLAPLPPPLFARLFPWTMGQKYPCEGGFIAQICPVPTWKADKFQSKLPKEPWKLQYA